LARCARETSSRFASVTVRRQRRFKIMPMQQTLHLGRPWPHPQAISGPGELACNPTQRPASSVQSSAVAMPDDGAVDEYVAVTTSGEVIRKTTFVRRKRSGGLDH
jgi:hypothetical protein